MLTSVLALGAFQKDDVMSSAKQPAPKSRAMNVLLVGTDNRDTVTQEEKKRYRLGSIGCGCTDTMMLVHIAQDRKRVSVISLPRDSLARIPAYTDRTGRKHKGHLAKINAAYAEGGPGLSMRTVENMTGVKIDRFLAVDFSRFMKTVDELGGLDICTDRRLKDPATALDLPVGTHHLGGGEALQYARSRKVDNLADFGRIQRQQKFLVSFIKEISSDGTLQNPVRLAKLGSVLLPSARTERAFTVKDVLSLARELRNIGLSSLEFATVPIKGYADIKGVGSTITWDEPKSAAVFKAVRAGRSLATAKAALPAGVHTTPGMGEFVPVKGTRLACS
ncbi:LCP family protein [Streptomyces sp. PSKA54]|uniref:LCP family protein n=1 Tax=Streptomyces himalayensis subsp. aureolus TaxID=2758039 RepID=A0A7W2CZV3_9ACTN|nr:LCP family protein [Streptomyces himalayensis]MBA4862197.1 LCP family protein [Streptomyces himalayensis subsp. aureolus]